MALFLSLDMEEHNMKGPFADDRVKEIKTICKTLKSQI